MKIWECIKFSRSVFGTFNLFFTPTSGIRSNFSEALYSKLAFLLKAQALFLPFNSLRLELSYVG